MILKVMFSGVILNVLSDFDLKSLCNVYFLRFWPFKGQNWLKITILE